jgi:hypothetical protein
MAARETDALPRRAERKKSIQCQPISNPVPRNAATDHGLGHVRNRHKTVITPKPAAAKAVRQIVTSTAESEMSFPKIAVNPQANTTR